MLKIIGLRLLFSLTLSIAFLTVLSCGTMGTSGKLGRDVKKNLPAYSLTQDFTEKPYTTLVSLSNESGQFFCSGVVISNDYAITAAHCLENQNSPSGGLRVGKIRVQAHNEPTVYVEAEAVALDMRSDLGLIKGNFEMFDKAPLALHPAGLTQIVGPVVNCGFPRGSVGICYQLQGLEIYYGLLAAQGLMFPGMSGGPVIDLGTGNVIAINSAVGNGFIVVAPLIGLMEMFNIEIKP